MQAEGGDNLEALKLSQDLWLQWEVSDGSHPECCAGVWGPVWPSWPRRGPAPQASLLRPDREEEVQTDETKLLVSPGWHSVILSPVSDVVTSEEAVLGMAVRVIETGGISLKQSLVRPDLTGCYWDDCWLCECGVKGASHTRSSAHYGGRCLECDKLGKRASYDGDTGKSGYYRTKQHRKARENANLNNAFAKHSEIYHK